MSKKQTFESNRRKTVVTIRAQIYPEKGGIHSLIVDTPKKPLKTLAEYLGSKEDKIVNWLMNDLGFKKELYEKLFNGEKNVHYFKTVEEPFTRNGENPGDIDLIVFKDINKAIAFECKIVKATSQPNGKVKINKAKKLKEGALQTNDYLKFGFSQVYFLIVILDDGRYYDKENFIFNHTPEEYLPQVYNGSWKEKLDERIGIIYCTIEMTRNLSVNVNNNISLKIKKIAVTNEQNNKTSQLLKEFIKYN